MAIQRQREHSDTQYIAADQDLTTILVVGDELRYPHVAENRRSRLAGSVRILRRGYEGHMHVVEIDFRRTAGGIYASLADGLQTKSVDYGPRDTGLARAGVHKGVADMDRIPIDRWIDGYSNPPDQAGVPVKTPE